MYTINDLRHHTNTVLNAHSERYSYDVPTILKDIATYVFANHDIDIRMKSVHGGVLYTASYENITNKETLFNLLQRGGIIEPNCYTIHIKRLSKGLSTLLRQKKQLIQQLEVLPLSATLTTQACQATVLQNPNNPKHLLILVQGGYVIEHFYKTLFAYQLTNYPDVIPKLPKTIVDYFNNKAVSEQDIINDILTTISLKSQKDKQRLEDIQLMATRVARSGVNNLTRLIANLKERIATLENDLAINYEQLNEKQQLQAAPLNVNTKAAEDFLMNNPDIVGIYIYNRNVESDAKFLFNIITPMQFSQKAIQQTNINSWIVNLGINNYQKQALIDIFINQKMQLLLQSVISVNFINNAYQRTTSPLYKRITIYNPHLYHYNCFGANASPLVKAITAKQLDTVCAMAINTVANVNFYDSPVVQSFKQDIVDNINHNSGSDILLKDPETNITTTFRDYVTKLKEGDVNNGSNN